MKIYVLLGHPDRESFNGLIFQKYCEFAIQKEHEVRAHALGDMKFDPILWKGYKLPPNLEPDLQQAQENILWCERWVIIYPMWWGTLPALLKGFLDRTLRSGFAFKYHTNDPFWDKLLAGRSAQIITTSDAPSWWIWWKYKNSDINALKKATLEFCGFKPVFVKRFDRIRYKNELEKQKILNSISKLI